MEPLSGTDRCSMLWALLIFVLLGIWTGPVDKRGVVLRRCDGQFIGYWSENVLILQTSSSTSELLAL